jgi:DNA ligase-1
MLANVHEPGTVVLGQYWASEKYDGIRAYWNGEALLTRAGHRISAPAWFIRDWPRHALDGELWIGRGRFEDVLATVRDIVPNEIAWREVRYMVFDLPNEPGRFSERRRALEGLLAHIASNTIEPVRHWRIQDEQSLERELNAIVDAGGEGLVLHKGDSLYNAGRSDDLLKVKPYLDAEACITAHFPGTGKYTNLLGALEVRTPSGMVFRIGTGFSDEQRKHPPDIGTCVTYRYHGLTANGVPRFARFLRVRAPEIPLQPTYETQPNERLGR